VGVFLGENMSTAGTLTVKDSIAAVNPGWLRNVHFDLTLIAGVTVLALSAGIAAVTHPQWEKAIIFANLWLLGYHHVISTYTRLVFDMDSFRKHKILVLILPGLVLLGTLALGYTLGLIAIVTLYFHWQWFHYTRQSYGIARAYMRKAQGTSEDHSRISSAALYLLPLWGILYRSYQSPQEFLGMEVQFLPVPELMVFAAGAISVGMLMWWAIHQIRSYLNRELSIGFSLYMVSHFIIFFVGYIAIEDITHGWLVINVWHNAQYIMFVWMANNNRFKQGVDPKHTFLSQLSQANPKNIVSYLLVCLSVTVIFYLSVYTLLKVLAFGSFTVAILIAFQVVNFHHYIVDAIIWRRPRALQVSKI